MEGTPKAAGPRRESLLFLTLLLLGVLFSYLSVAIPGTEAHIDVRLLFAFLGFALLRSWTAPLLLALGVAAAGPHQIPLLTATLYNLFYLVPIFVVVRLVYRRLLGRIPTFSGYGFAWAGLILLCYQLFLTPIIWGLIGYLRGVPILPMVVEGWVTQPYLVESAIVAALASLSFVLYRVYCELVSTQRELRTTLYSIGDGVIATDSNGRVRRLNSAAAALTGWSEAEARDRPLEEVFDISNEETGEAVETPVRRVLEEGIVVGLANHTVLRGRDGTLRPILDSGAPIRGVEGAIDGVVLVFRDQTNERLAERVMQTTLADREILLRELYHRTKNNMNVISSMLSLRASESGSREIEELVRETESRIQTIALVHDKLYQTGDLSQVDLGEYIQELSQLLIEGYAPVDGRIQLRVETDSITGAIDIAVPCGLLVNELISNCLKHAYPDGRSGSITVWLRGTAEGSIELSVGDDGVGFPAGFDPLTATTLGSQTIILLVEHQLQGTIVFDGTEGVRVTARFSPGLYPRRG